MSYPADTLYIKNYLESHYPECDICPCDEIDPKRPKYKHKNNSFVWKNEYFAECDTNGAVILLSDELVVVDLDDTELALELEETIPLFKDTVQVITSKGKHYYFNNTNECKSVGIRCSARLLVDPVSGITLPIDIRTAYPNGTRGIISIPSGQNGKTWYKKLGDFHPIDMPSDFCSYWKQRDTTNIKNNKLSTASDDVDKLLSILKKERFDNYDEWMYVGFCLFSINESYL